MFCIAVVSGVWGLVALHLADDMILPFRYLSYADQLQVRVAPFSYVDYFIKFCFLVTTWDIYYHLLDIEVILVLTEMVSDFSYR